MILHTINASPSSNAFRECLRLVQKEDAVLLMGDAVYAAIQDTRVCQDLFVSGAEILVLEADAVATGVITVISDVQLIGMPGFVELTERFPLQQAWY